MAMTRRTMLRTLLCGGLLGVAVGCAGDGHFKILGYSSCPNYDRSIRTIYVPILRTRAFQTGPFRDVEMHITRAIIREIHKRTPYRVVDDPERADTELLATVTGIDKIVTNRNLNNEIRDHDLYINVEVVWRDLRTGRVLTNSPPPAYVIDPSKIPAFDPSNPGVPLPVDTAIPVKVVGVGRGIPELGESSTTAIQMAVDNLAVTIAELMEAPWELPQKPVSSTP